MFKSFRPEARFHARRIFPDVGRSCWLLRGGMGNSWFALGQKWIWVLHWNIRQVAGQNLRCLTCSGNSADPDATVLHLDLSISIFLQTESFR